MKASRGKSADDSPWVGMIRDQIKLFHEKIKEDPKENIKLAEVQIKMIELLQKHVPGGADQKRFWKLVEDIRQGTSSDPPKKKAGRRKSTTTEKKKK